MQPQKSSRSDDQMVDDWANRPTVRRQSTSLPFCSICQTNISSEDPSRHCQACELPFHTECWDDNKGCATFGCAGAPRVEPIRVSPPEPPELPPDKGSGGIGPDLDQSIDAQRTKSDMEWFLIGIASIVLAFVPWLGWGSTCLWTICVAATVNEASANSNRPEIPHKEFLAFAVATCVMGWFIRLVLIPNL